MGFTDLNLNRYKQAIIQFIRTAMTQISSAGNSDTACFGALIQKGYRVGIIKNSDGKTGLYKAERNGDVFIGHSPIEILGLIALFELRGEEWAPTDKEIDGNIRLEEVSFTNNISK